MRLRTLSSLGNLPSDSWLNPLWSFSPFMSLTNGIGAVELQETGDAVIVTADFPGIHPHDIDVAVSPETLILSGQQQTEYRRNYGYAMGYRQFQHAIPLPTQVQDNQMQTAVQGNQLVITLQKAGHSGRIRHVTPHTAMPNYSGTLVDEARHQGQRLSQSWRQAKRWLGQQLQKAGDRLLED